MVLPSNTNPPAIQVNALPSVEQLDRLCQDLFRHVDDADQDLATVHLALKALVMLAEHDLGFCIVHRTIGSHPKVFLNLISRVNNTFSKDSPDCLTTLLTTLELLRTLVITDSLEGVAMPLRTKAISVLEVCSRQHSHYLSLTSVGTDMADFEVVQSCHQTFFLSRLRSC